MKPETFHPSRQTWLRSCWGLMVCAPSGSFFVLGMHLRKAPQLLSLLIKFYQSSRLRDRRIGTACFYQLLSKFYRSNLVFVASRNVVLREVVSDPGTKTACTMVASLLQHPIYSFLSPDPLPPPSLCLHRHMCMFVECEL